MSVSPRRFEGWAPQTTTRYAYDQGGRVVSAVSMDEPEWDELDRAIVDAHLWNEAQRCRCGGYLDETTTDDHGYRITAEQCYRCEAELRWHERQQPIDELMKSTRNKPYPEARVLSVEAIPLPPPDEGS